VETNLQYLFGFKQFFNVQNVIFHFNIVQIHSADLIVLIALRAPGTDEAELRALAFVLFKVDNLSFIC